MEWLPRLQPQRITLRPWLPGAARFPDGNQKLCHTSSAFMAPCSHTSWQHARCDMKNMNR